MRTKELLLQCQVKLQAQTEYKLAKALGLPTQRIYDYMAGKRTPNAYAAIKIAECLGLDPLELIAEFEEAGAKNETERSFWAGFRLRVKKPIKAFMVALLCTLSLLAGSPQGENAGGVFRRGKHA